MLPPGFSSIGEMPGRWWAGHTKSRFEKVFAWELLDRQVNYYLPLVERTRISGGRKRRVLYPLFPSYVFFCGDQDARLHAFETNRLCTVVEIVDQARFIRELSAIEIALRERLPVRLYPQVTPGSYCYIRRGPLKDFEGIVVKLKGKSYVILRVSALGTSVLVETDLDFVEVSEPPRDPAAPTCPRVNGKTRPPVGRAHSEAN